MIRVLVQGLNPEPWRAPQLGIKKVGKRAVPVAFKDENLRGYQEGLAEMVTTALAELGVPLPVFPKGTLLHVQFSFWRQLEQYVNAAGRTSTRNRPDATNMQKAAEDALQGVLYANDKDNRLVSAELVECGIAVEPAVLIEVSWLQTTKVDWLRDAMLQGNAVADKSGDVWVEQFE